MSKLISIQHLNAAARQLASDITVMFKKTITSRSVHLYGVSRGGITAAYAVAAMSGPQYLGMTLVDKPEDADIIIDDLIDSGKTLDHYSTLYPKTPFVTLFGKPKEWLIFPWEVGDENCSADDIPTRLLQYILERRAVEVV